MRCAGNTVPCIPSFSNCTDREGLMTMQGTFWSLVKHDMKLRKRRTGQYSTWWRLFYGAAVVVAAIAVTT